MAPEVVVFTRDRCGYCDRAKRYLTERKKVAYREVNITGDYAARSALEARTNWYTFPFIFVGDTFVGGFEEMRDLDLDGGLDPLLNPA